MVQSAYQLTRKQIRDLVIDVTNRSDKESLINSAMNLGLEEITRRHFWKGLQLTVESVLPEDQDTVELPEGFLSFLELRLIDGTASHQIEVRHRDWVLQRYPKPDELAASKPRLAYLTSSHLILLPAPDDDYGLQMSYSRFHPPLESDSDTLLIPVKEALVSYATAWVYKATEMFEESTMWMRDFERLIRVAIRKDYHPGEVTVAEGHGEQGQNNLLPGWQDPFQGF